MSEQSIKTVVLFAVTLLFMACGHERPSRIFQPRAKQGLLDLRDWSFETHGPVDLGGDYEFYWLQHLPPARFSHFPAPQSSGFIKVHRSWNGHIIDGKELLGTGYATYRLTVLLPDVRPLALKFLDMGTAYSVFVNNKKLVSVGAAATTAEKTIPQYFPQVVDFVPDSDRLEIIYHVSNFHHHRGGAWEVIRLGTHQQMHLAREHRLQFDLFLFGAIFILGIYNLALFSIRGKSRSSLYLGLSCILIAMRILTTVERYLMHLFPNIDDSVD